MRRFAFALCLLASALPAIAEEVANAPRGEVRVLDKITGEVTDLALVVGESAEVGHLLVTLDECRYPVDNPAGNAYGLLTVSYAGTTEPVFQGWMIAAAPALNALDHPRYDVWMLRCINS